MLNEGEKIYIRHNSFSYKNVSDVRRSERWIVRRRIINNKEKKGVKGKSGKRMKFSPLSSQKKMS